MEDNMIAIAASFVFQLMLDAWEVYMSVPAFVLVTIFSTQSPPNLFWIVIAYLLWLIITAILAFLATAMAMAFFSMSKDAKTSKRIFEIKQATLSALAESANSDEAHCTLPSKATDERNQARTEALLKQIVKAIESKSN